MKKKILSLIQVSFTIFFIYYTVSKIDFNVFIDVIKSTKSKFLILASIIYFLSQIVSSERLRYILQKNNFTLGFDKNLYLYFIGLFYNFFIPGGVSGDAYKGYLMSSIFKWNLKKTLKLIVLDRLIGFGVLCSILILLLEVIFFELNIILIVLTFTIVYCFGFILVKFIFKNQRIYFKTYLLSIISHILQFISLITILLALNINSNYFEIIIVFIISSIFSVLSVGGIGVREYIFLSTASILNYSPEVSASIGLLFTFSACISSLPGLIFLIFKKSFIK